MVNQYRQDGRRWVLLGVLALFCGPATLSGQEVGKRAAARPLHEFWEAVHLQGSPIGYAHGIFHQKSAQVIEGEEEMRLTVHRFGQPMRLEFKMTMLETNDGQVLQFTHRQTMGRDEELVRAGVVENGKLKLAKVMGNKQAEEKIYPWDDRALGLYAQEQIYAKREVKAGLKFNFSSFVPEFNTVLTSAVSVGEKQPTELLGGRKVGFWPATVMVEKIAGMQFPPMICWVNDSGEVYKREQNFPGLGDVTFYRTSKERAVSRPETAMHSSDIGISQLVRVNRSIPSPNQTKEVIYRAKLKDTEDLESAFVKDDRQQVRVVGKDELEIKVTSQPRPPLAGVRKAAPEAFLRSSHFITAKDPEVVKLAKKAVAATQDSWEKALKIEAWVRQNMTNREYGKAFATAAETAKSLDGDCTEHAVLAAAMCRAVGLPSRTAIGLVHVPDQRAMCFHMWFEVWINGQWHALDGTLGEGRVGAGHVKVLDAHWNDTDSFLPLLPVVRVLGKLKMEILSVEYEAGLAPR